MKTNTIQNLIHFIFKYIWLFFTILVTVELVYTLYHSKILMQQSSNGVLQSVCDEVSGRVDGVVRLLNGLSHDKIISDTSIPLFERATLLLPFQESYGLYMIAICDENVNVVSADETEPSKEPFSLAHRDYMQRLYSTGEIQITDAFVAGADNSTMNYTIAVPIKEANSVKGCIFGSIYFDDIQNIIKKSLNMKNNQFYLIGTDNVIMAGANSDIEGKNFLDATKSTYFLTSSAEDVNQNMLDNHSDSYWEFEDGDFWYVSFQTVEPTNWTLVHRTRFSSIIEMLLPGLILKIAFYGAMCALIYIFGPKYIRTHLADVNHLLNRMASMQKELFQTDKGSLDTLLDLTQDGLVDHLTGLSTRTVFLQKSTQIIQDSSSVGALMFVDLDDLKKINDNFGHEAGDLSIIHFGKVLKKFQQERSAVAARYGGDEFIILFDNLKEPDISAVAATLCKELQTEITINNHTFQIHGSIGISFYPMHGSTLETLIGKADLALYTSKRSGKNQYTCFTEI